jgi:putative spermidine/putrescine transport system substrate-binding protein
MLRTNALWKEVAHSHRGHSLIWKPHAYYEERMMKDKLDKTQSSLTRRQVIQRGAALGIAASASGPHVIGSAKQSELSGELVVPVAGGSWGDAFQANMIDPFVALHPNVKVQVDLTADAERLVKLRAAGGNNPPLDIVGLSTEFMDAAIREDLVDPFTAEEVPNATELYKISTPENWTTENGFLAIHQNWGQLGIAYRTDLVETVPKAWLDLWNPEYEGLVGFGPLTYSAALQFFIATVRALGGHESNPEDVDAAFAKIEELKPNVAQTPADSGAVQNLLERGEIGLVHLWDGRAFGLAEAGLPVDFVYPTDPGPVASGAPRGIAKGTNNREVAVAFLDYTLSPEAQKGFCETMWYGPSNVNVELSEEVAAKVQYGDESYSQLFEPDYEAVTVNLGDWQKRWTRIFSS